MSKGHAQLQTLPETVLEPLCLGARERDGCDGGCSSGQAGASTVGAEGEAEAGLEDTVLGMLLDPIQKLVSGSMSY